MGSSYEEHEMMLNHPPCSPCCQKPECLAFFKQASNLHPPLLPTTACSRFRCRTVEVTRHTQTTSVAAAAAAARQLPDLKLFSVRLPWRQDLLLFSRHGRQFARQLLLFPQSPPFHPLSWAHLQRVADPHSRRHAQG